MGVAARRGVAWRRGVLCGAWRAWFAGEALTSPALAQELQRTGSSGSTTGNSKTMCSIRSELSSASCQGGTTLLHALLPTRRVQMSGPQKPSQGERSDRPRWYSNNGSSVRVVRAHSLRGIPRLGKFCLTFLRGPKTWAPRRVPPGPGMTCCVAAASRCMDGFSSGSGSVKNSETLRNQEVWLPPVYNKSPAAETIITKALEANILMKELSVEDRTVTLALSNPRLRLRPLLTSPSPQPPPLPRATPPPTPTLVLARR